MPFESVKAPTKSITVIESPLEGNNLEALNNKEPVDPDEGWMVFESKEAHKRREWPLPRLSGKK